MKAKIYGLFLLFEAGFMFLASVVSLYFYNKCQDDDFTSLFSSALITGVVGFVLLSLSRDRKRYTSSSVSVHERLFHLDYRDSFSIVVVTWVLFVLFGMLPFLLYGTFDNVTDAFFETMAGFSTTGSTLLTNIDAQPHGILLWRSGLQWLGGLGIIVLFLAILPAINSNSNKTLLFSAETTGLGVRKLFPKMRNTAQILWIVYIALTIICTLFYWAGPMNLFDAFNHALTTIATGGFSTHQTSIGYFNSPYIEYVCMVFMFLSGINFTLYFFIFTGQFKKFWKEEETHWYIKIIFIFTVIFVILFYLEPDLNTIHPDKTAYPEGVEPTIRAALFHTISMITSSGYQASCFNYYLWGGLFIIPTLFLVASGACAGSTSGGIKLVREILCLKGIRNELRHVLHPNGVFTVKYSGEVVELSTIWRTHVFIFFYIILFIIGVCCLCVSGCTFEESVFNAVSSLSNTGPGIGRFAPDSTFVALTPFAKWVMSILMLVGRLEIFTFIVVVLSMFRRKK